MDNMELHHDHESSYGGRRRYSNGNRGGLWDSWVRIVSSFVLGALSAVYLLGGKSRDVSDLVAWRATVAAKIEANSTAITSCANKNDEHEREIAKLDARVDKLQDDTKQVPVIESEHRRLTQEVDRLINGKK